MGGLGEPECPSWLVPIPGMLFLDVAGLLGWQEGWDGRHAAAPCCLLTRLLGAGSSGNSRRGEHPLTTTRKAQRRSQAPPSHQECECSCWNHPVQGFHGQISGEATAELSGIDFEVEKMRMTLLWLPFSQMLSQS